MTTVLNQMIKIMKKTELKKLNGSYWPFRRHLKIIFLGLLFSTWGIQLAAQPDCSVACGNFTINIATDNSACIGESLIIYVNYGPNDNPLPANSDSFDFRWYKKVGNNYTLLDTDDSNSNYELVEGDNLRIKSLEADDAAEYQLELLRLTPVPCSQCSDISTVAVEVVDLPQSITLADQAISCDNAQSSVTFTPIFMYNGVPQNCPEPIDGVTYDFIWRKGNQTLDTNGTKYDVEPNCGALTINDLENNDEGDYQIILIVRKNNQSVGSRNTTANLTVEAAPNVTHQTVVSSNADCSVDITLNIPGDMSLVESIRWTRGVGNSAENLPAFNDQSMITVNEDIRYTATITFTDDCIATEIIDNLNLPSGPTINNISQDGFAAEFFEICPDAMIDLLLSANNVSSVSWSANGQEIATGSSVSFDHGDFTSGDATTVTITATADNGCVASTSIDILAVSVEGTEPFNLTIVDGVPSPIGSLEGSWEEVDQINLTSLQFNEPVDGNTGSITAVLASDRSPGGVIYTFTPESSNCSGEPITISFTVLPKVAEGPFIPEVISPNGDGVNDDWQIVFPNQETDPANYSIQIYNRLGGLVYDMNNYLQPWDATNCADGVYYYILTNTDGGEQFKGAVTVVGKN